MLSSEERRESQERIRNSLYEKAKSLARTGVGPSEKLDADTLAMVFRGREHELDELDEVARQARVQRHEDQERKQQDRQVRMLADQILAGWDAQRRREAEAEARRRLGLDEDAAA
jgi:hypothetical protein